MSSVARRHDGTKALGAQRFAAPLGPSALLRERVEEVHDHKHAGGPADAAEPPLVNAGDLVGAREAGERTIDGEPERGVAAPEHEAVGLDHALGFDIPPGRVVAAVHGAP